MTELTARVPTTPETRDRLRDEVEGRADVDRYEDLLQEFLDNRGDRGN